MSEQDSVQIDRPVVNSPWLQASRLAFLGLYVVTLMAALGWAVSNVRQIDPQNRAVVFRFGELDRVQNAGLLLAWPQPFEQVVLLPSANEGLALVCYEAIAAGCVPVTTDVGAQCEIVPQGVLVHRAPFRTVSETVAAVKCLLTDESFLATVCEEMREKFDRLRADPLAKELLMPLYTKAAERPTTVMVAQ